MVGGSYTWLKCTRVGVLFHCSWCFISPHWVLSENKSGHLTAHMIYNNAGWVMDEWLERVLTVALNRFLTLKISPWWATYGALMWVFGENYCVMMRWESSVVTFAQWHMCQYPVTEGLNVSSQALWLFKWWSENTWRKWKMIAIMWHLTDNTLILAKIFLMNFMSVIASDQNTISITCHSLTLILYDTH